MSDRTYTPAQMRLIDKNRDINVDHDWWDCTYEQFVEECAVFGIEISTITHTFDAKGPDGKFLRGADGKGVTRSYTRPEVYFSLHQQGAGAYFRCTCFTVPQLIEKGRAVMLLPDDADNAHFKTAESPVIERLRNNFLRLEREFGVYLLSAEMKAVLDECTYTPSILHENIYIDSYFDPYSDGDATEAQKALAGALENDWPEVIRDMLRDVARALHKELEAEYDEQTSNDAVWDTIEANDLHVDEDEEEVA